jgi:23S rRNA pseudouridine2605 synthase
VSEERLQKLIASTGLASRRAAEALIAAGRVTIDGRVAALGERADPATQVVAVDGVPLAVALPRVHLALHKPIGVTSTVRDRHAARTVIDLVPASFMARGTRPYPVGRLDRDSEGLILLTDDGPWADRVAHPRYEVEREYAFLVDRPLDEAQARALLEGIELAEGVARLATLRRASRTEVARFDVPRGWPASPRAGDGPGAWYLATLRQGWKRQIRRMLGAVGAPVRRLVRVRIGPIRLGDLAPGEVRALTPAEVRRLAGGPRERAVSDRARGRTGD